MNRTVCRLAALIITAGSLLPAACIGGADTVAGTGTRAFTGGTTTGGTTTGGVDQALLGRWSRTILVQGESGPSNSSQLIWEFSSGGGARRTTVITDFELGVSLAEVVPALWRAASGAIDITFLPPGAGSVRYQYAVSPSRLMLGPFDLERIP
jgi:hypothetical protein